MNFRIEHLGRAQWAGYVLQMDYPICEIYDARFEETDADMSVRLTRRALTEPRCHDEPGDYPDKLYADWWPDACAWGAFSGDELIGVIETCPEEWSNRLRVTEIWVREDCRRQGAGHALMQVAREQARLERRRGILLETQSCNVGAIDFYRQEGFSLIGLDRFAYTNSDVERGEVRLEMGWLRERAPYLTPDEVEIRPETPADFRETEEITRLAFWNKYKPGCDEHYLVHLLRESPDYLPALSRVAVHEGRIVGAIFYSRARVGEREVLCFGPLGVHPQYQGRGVGGMLLKETVALAREAGWPGIVIFGEPDYYPRHGFLTADHFSITTADGGNFPAFMALELREGSLAKVQGAFREAPVFEALDAEGLMAFDASFPLVEKYYMPRQFHG